VGVDVDTVKVAIVTTSIDVTVIHCRNTAGSREADRPRGTVAEVPQLLTGGKTETAQIISDLIIPIQQIHLAIADSRSAEPPANFHCPMDFRPAFRPGAEDACFLRCGIPLRPEILRPVCR
jgi:hypothetical protein